MFFEYFQSSHTFFHSEELSSHESQKKAEDALTKTKNIKKQTKRTGKRKSKRHHVQRKFSNNVPLGRPKPQAQNDIFQIGESQEENLKYTIQSMFISYLKDIGIVKGLVFDHSVRKQLKQMQLKAKRKVPEIEWSQKHFWDYSEEKQKARKVLNKFQFSYEKIESLEWYFVEICEIFASQTTQEIYDFLIRIIRNCYLFKTQYERSCNRREICDEIMNDGKFLNQKFTSRGIKHKIQKKKAAQIQNKLLIFIEQLEPLMEEL